MPGPGKHAPWRGGADLSSRRLLAAPLTLLLAGSAVAQSWDDVAGPAAGTAETIGGYTAGCVIGAARLPADGAGYQAVRPGRNRYYGHPELVEFVESLARRAETAGIGLLPVGDMSQPRGGPMIDSHASHQAGLDVDIFFRLDLPRLPDDERGEGLELPNYVSGDPPRLDAGFGTTQRQLLRLAATSPNVARIFVNPLIKLDMCEQDWADRGFLRRLRPWYGHADHMHVRLDCPAGNDECVAQPAPPAGDGCGAELRSWLDRGALPDRPPGVRREPDLPPRCDALR